MNHVAVAKTLDTEKIVALLKVQESFELLQVDHQDLQINYEDLQGRYQQAAAQLKWFNDQLFGTKSEIRKPIANSQQLSLGEQFVSKEQGAQDSSPKQTVTYQRGKAKKKPLEGQITSQGLQFDKNVPVREIETDNPAIKDLAESEYEVIGTKESFMLAQKPASYEVLKFTQLVVKIKGEVSSNPKPAPVFDNTYADVSFLANLVIDKYLYHLPLYRQHQRITAAGIKISRATLTNYVHRTAAVLKPIYQALIASIASGSIVWMDETKVKAGKVNGKMKLGYFWSIYGEKEEVAFYYNRSRGHEIIVDVLGEDFSGILETDDYAAYETYSNKLESVEHALCWSHTRRKFLKAEDQEKELAETALAYIRELYKIEKLIKNPKKTQEIRGSKSKLVVDQFFAWLKDTFNQKTLLPSSMFTQAANYALDNERGLRVFLSNPHATLDTNHLERQIRPIAVGRKNWMFCDTEAGAEVSAVIYSLIASCKLQDINPYHYLVDVLQRVQVHPQADIAQLIPANWKTHFPEDQRLKSLVDC